MGLLGFLSPLLPVRAVVKLAEVIQKQVEQEMNNPARTRRQLEELQEMRQRGEISAEEEREAQAKILGTMIPSAPPKASPPQPSPTPPATPTARRANPQAGTPKRRGTAKQAGTPKHGTAKQGATPKHGTAKQGATPMRRGTPRRTS